MEDVRRYVGFHRLNCPHCQQNFFANMSIEEDWREIYFRILARSRPLDRDITWVRSRIESLQMALLFLMHGYTPLFHWSRRFEYPWVLLRGRFQPGQRILDAAGGDAPLSCYLADLGCLVTNVDCNPEQLRNCRPPGIVPVVADLRHLEQFGDGHFDHVLCLSVLEHIAKPFEVVAELWRVLKPGGSLFITLDVASAARYNHTIDMAGAGELVRQFGFSLPALPADVESGEFTEIDSAVDDPSSVNLNTLCFFCHKG